MGTYLRVGMALPLAIERACHPVAHAVWNVAHRTPVTAAVGLVQATKRESTR